MFWFCVVGEIGEGGVVLCVVLVKGRVISRVRIWCIVCCFSWLVWCC